jgi:hypothetical protein
MKKLCLIVCLTWSLQSVAQTTPPPISPPGLILPYSTGAMVMELLKTIMNYGLSEYRKEEERKTKLATVIEEYFEEDL